MTQWDERFKNHAVFSMIEQVRSSLEPAKETRKEHLKDDQNAAEGLDRVEALVDWIVRQLEATDPYYASPNSLKSIQSLLNQANNELTQFVANRNPGHIQNANTHLENAIPTCSQLPRPVSSADIAALGDAASSYRRSVGQLAAKLGKDIEALSSKVSESKEKAAEVNTEIGQQKTRLDEAIAQFQQQASAAQESHRKEADQAIEDLRAKFAAAEETRANDHSAVLAELQEKHETTQNELQDLREKAQRLVNAVGSAGMSTGYQQVANKLRIEAFVWQAIAAFALVFLVVAQLWFIPPLVEGYDPWQIMTFRTIFSAGFVLLAGYGAAQAKRAHRLEESNRGMELQMASLDPFLVNLPEALQNEIRKQTAKRFFSGQEPPDEENAG